MAIYDRKQERALKQRRAAGGWGNWYINRNRMAKPWLASSDLVAQDMRMISNRRAL